MENYVASKMYDHIKHNFTSSDFDKALESKYSIFSEDGAGDYLGKFDNYELFMAHQWNCLHNYDQKKLKVIYKFLTLNINKYIHWSDDSGIYVNIHPIDTFIFDYKGDFLPCI